MDVRDLGRNVAGIVIAGHQIKRVKRVQSRSEKLVGCTAPILPQRQVGDEVLLFLVRDFQQTGQANRSPGQVVMADHDGLWAKPEFKEAYERCSAIDLYPTVCSRH